MLLISLSVDAIIAEWHNRGYFVGVSKKSVGCRKRLWEVATDDGYLGGLLEIGEQKNMGTGGRSRTVSIVL